MSFFRRLVSIFISPAVVFADIRDGSATWWQPWLWMSVIYMIVGYFSIPIQRAVTLLNERGLGQEELALAVEQFDKWVLVQLFATPVLLLVTSLLFAGLTYILVTILSPNSTFKKYFTIMLWASVVGSVSNIISTIVVRARGVDLIRTADDARVSLGLAFMAPEGSRVGLGILQATDFFALWSLALVAVGIMAVFGMSKGQAIACVVPLWLIYVAISLLGTLLGAVG